MKGKPKKKDTNIEQQHHLRKILRITGKELKSHLPFTITGTVTAILFLLVILFLRLLETLQKIDEPIFFILHPGHIFLSALVTTGIFLRYGTKGKLRIPMALLIGTTGSLGIATLSDSIIPYLGEILIGLDHANVHVGFIEEPLITITPAIIGTLIAFKLDATQFPHLGHVLLSTYASLFHIIIALDSSVKVLQLYSSA